jgi:hypothetical protein
MNESISQIENGLTLLLDILMITSQIVKLIANHSIGHLTCVSNIQIENIWPHFKCIIFKTFPTM